MIDGYITQYGKRLFGLCLTLCGNRQDAEDLYQDTWLKALKELVSYDTSRPFEPWLTQICVNTYRNFLRRRARSPFVQFSSGESRDQLFATLAAPERQDYQDLHRAIDRLPDKLRLTVILFYFRDMDVNETAKVLKVPPGTVKSRLNNARKRLKEVLTHGTDLQF